MNEYTLAFDVGGLFIKSAVLNSRGAVFKDTNAIYPSKSKAEKEILLEHLVSIIHQQINQINDKSFRINGIGFAFPGPFDYENGISYMKDIDKFEHIYGVNLRAELTRRIQEIPVLRAKLSPYFQIVFENDASLFALGTLLEGSAAAGNRFMCLTLGTGAGSAFIDQGELVKDREDVPANGWIYNDPFRDSIVDDYISKRGIMRLAKERNLDENLDIKVMADLARSGNEAAAEVFRQFGSNLGEMVVPYLQSFRPEGLVIGGQIAKSCDLFENAFREKLGEDPVIVEFIDQTSLNTFAGVAKLLQNESSKQKFG
jgi:glucokinase